MDATPSLTTLPSRLRAVAVLLGLCALIVALHMAGSLVSADVTFDDPIAVVATASRWIALVLSYYLVGIVGATMLFGERLHETRWGRFAPPAAVGVVSVLLGTSAVVIPMTIKVDDNAHDPNIAVPDMALVLEELDNPLTLVESTPSVDLAPPQLVDAASVDWWVAEPGDSLWSIAQEHLQDELGNDDLPEEVIAEYWRTLIDANTDRLSDPTNPDLILPGQQFVLPRIPN